jgi:hypothetical protein
MVARCGVAFGFKVLSALTGAWRREIKQERRKRKSKMDMRKYAGENFIGVDDVRNEPLQVQIRVVKEGKFDKPNLIFETGELLGLNATNTRILVRSYGPPKRRLDRQRNRAVPGRG